MKSKVIKQLSLSVTVVVLCSTNVFAQERKVNIDKPAPYNQNISNKHNSQIIKTLSRKIPNRKHINMKTKIDALIEAQKTYKNQQKKIKEVKKEIDKLKKSFEITNNRFGNKKTNYLMSTKKYNEIKSKSLDTFNQFQKIKLSTGYQKLYRKLIYHTKQSNIAHNAVIDARQELSFESSKNNTFLVKNKNKKIKMPGT